MSITSILLRQLKLKANSILLGLFVLRHSLLPCFLICCCFGLSWFFLNTRGDGTFGGVAPEDIAQAIANIALHPTAHVHTAYLLTSEVLLSGNILAAAFSKALKKVSRRKKESC